MKSPTPRMTDVRRPWFRTFTRTVESFFSGTRQRTGRGWENALTLIGTQLEELEQSAKADLNRILWQDSPVYVLPRKGGIVLYPVFASSRVASPQTPVAQVPGNED